MWKTALLLLIIVAFVSCKSAKNKRIVTKKSRTEKTSTKKTRTEKPVTKTIKTTNTSINTKASAIIINAEAYKGTRYKYGGTTKAGMDCSGLIYTAFKKEKVSIPRVSSAMATSGDWVDIKEVKPGDLLFFATKKNSRKVNHVGLVTTARTGNVEFIHASTSKGVITSNLAEKYWYFAFVQARRVL